MAEGIKSRIRLGQIKFDTTKAIDADVAFTGDGGRQFIKFDKDGNVILGDASAGVSLDGALSGTQVTGLGNGKLLKQAAGIAGGDFLKINGTVVEGRDTAQMQSDLSINAALDGLALGIANNNLMQANNNVSDDDFLRIDGTKVEGLTAAQTLTALSGVAAGDFSINNRKITSLANPTNGTDAATKGYVDSVAEGLEVKESVRAASVANIAGTYNAGNGTITAAGNGALPAQDGINLSNGDRLLVKEQTDKKQNGIYVVTNPGSNGAAYVLTRASDYDQDEDISTGNFFFVEEGTSFADAGLVMSNHEFTGLNNNTGNQGKIEFTQFSGAGSITGGSGITKSGNTISVTRKLNGGIVDEAGALKIDVGQSAVEGTLPVARGGSGQTSYTDGQLLIGNSSGNTLAKATLTGGSGVEVVNGNGSIQINVDRKNNGGLVDDAGELKIDLAQTAVEGIDRFSGQTFKRSIMRSGGTLAGDTDLQIGSAGGGGFSDGDWSAADEADREVYLNGQLLLEGANAGDDLDFYPGSASGRVKFEFAIEDGDILTFVYRKK